MRFKTLAAITAVAVNVLAAATPAAADWQYTRWGMTPQQVVRASGGGAQLRDVPPNPGQIHIIKAVGTVRSGNLNFRAEFRFAENRLVSVRLVPTNTTCGRLSSILREKYGEPVRNSFMPGYLRWRSDADNFRVTFNGMTADCDVSYSPLVSDNASAL